MLCSLVLHGCTAKAQEGEGVLPITAYTGKFHPKGSQVYERVGILLAVVYKKAGKFVISICKIPKRSNSCKKVLKISWVCDLFISKDSAFTAVKRDATTVVI